MKKNEHLSKEHAIRIVDTVEHSIRIVDTVCQNCHENCKIQCQVENGRLVKIKTSRCEKGAYLHEILYNPDRVLYPLKRIGERGGGQWTRISWDEALDLMAGKFKEIRKRYGPEANCVGIGSHHKFTTVMASHLSSKILNTPNVYDSNYQCSKGGALADHYTIGARVTWETRIDFEHSKCIVLWGANITETGPAKSIKIFNAQKKGAKVIVIDPRPIPAAKKSDIWLRIRPGSDGALALGWLHILIEEEMYDKDFVKKHCYGFDELRERVQPWTPERVSQITWLPKEQIIEAARLYGKTRPSCIRTRVGVDGQSLNSTQTSRAISCLIAIKGDIDVPGGNLLPTPTSYSTKPGTKDTYLKGFKDIWWLARNWGRAPELESKRIGYNEYPIWSGHREMDFFNDYVSHNYLLLEAIKKGTVRGLYLPGANPVVHAENAKKVWNILKQLDFMVVVDIFMTPTAELADLVLPAAHWAETNVVTNSWEGYGNTIVACPKVVEPPGECWDDRLIVLELGKRMGEDVPWNNVDEFNNYCLESLGITFDDLLGYPGQRIEFPVEFKKYERLGWLWNTPTGKIELYSTRFMKLRYDPLPNYKEEPVSPLSTPDLWKEYPLIMVNHRFRYYMHTEQRNCPSLRKKAPKPEIEIHPQTARNLGIDEGDWMWLESYQLKGERVKGKAKFVKEIHPNVVSMLMGWWFPEYQEAEHGYFQSNINTITSDGPPFEEFDGHAQMRGILCKAGKL